MADSIGGLTVEFLREQQGRKPQPSKRLRQHIEGVPFASGGRNVISSGGFEPERWAGRITCTAAVAASLKSTSYYGTEAALTIVIDGVSKSGWLMDFQETTLPRGTDRECRVVLLFES